MQPVSKKLKKVWGRSHDLWTNCLDGVDWLCHCDFEKGRKMNDFLFLLTSMAEGFAVIISLFLILLVGEIWSARKENL